MVLSISGTSVINDSRQLENITNLKTVNGSSLLGTGDIALNRLVVVGTITTTSGNAASISSLSLGGYKCLMFLFDNVSHSSGTAQSLLLGTSTSDDVTVSGTFAAANVAYLIGTLDLADGILSIGGITTTVGGSGVTSTTRSVVTPITNASTSISVAISGGSFDLGSVKVYGVG